MSSAGALTEQLGVLQRELETLGFTLDSRGSREAADVALTIAARIGELREVDCATVNCPEKYVRSAVPGSLFFHQTSP